VRARDFFNQSHEHALKAFGPFGSKTMDAMRGQMYAERQLRNFGEALRLLDLLEGAAAKSTEVDATDAAAIARDRVDLLFNAGRFAESLRVAVAASPKCALDLGQNHRMCRNLLFSKVNAMLRLGLTERASEELPALELIAGDPKSPALRANTLLTILKLDLATGDRMRQATTFQQVKDLVQSRAGDTFGQAFKTKALLLLAETRLRSGDPPEAERMIEEAVSPQRQRDGKLPLTMEMAVAKSLRGVALLESGRAAEALQSLSECRSDLSTLFGPNDPITSLFSLNLALALERLSHDDEALAVVERAEPVLREAMGTTAPAYLRAKAFRDRLERSNRATVSRDRVAGPPAVPGTARERSLSIDFFG